MTTGPAVYWDQAKGRLVAIGDADYVDPGPQPGLDPEIVVEYPAARYVVDGGTWVLDRGSRSVHAPRPTAAAAPGPAPSEAAPDAPPAPAPAPDQPAERIVSEERLADLTGVIARLGEQARHRDRERRAREDRAARGLDRSSGAPPPEPVPPPEPAPPVAPTPPGAAATPDDVLASTARAPSGDDGPQPFLLDEPPHPPTIDHAPEPPPAIDRAPEPSAHPPAIDRAPEPLSAADLIPEPPPHPPTIDRAPEPPPTIDRAPEPSAHPSAADRTPEPPPPLPERPPGGAPTVPPRPERGPGPGGPRYVHDRRDARSPFARGPVPGPAARPHRSRRGLLVALLVIGFVAIAAGLWLLLRDPGVAHPRTWDPRVRELVEFVERSRGMDFDHPVAVEVLDDESFTAALAAADRPVGQPPAAALADPDLEAAVARTIGAGARPDPSTGGVHGDVRAFYDAGPRMIVVRGDAGTPADGLAIVAALVHALQDQRLGLPTEADGRAGALAPAALVQGEARVVVEEHVATLPSDQRAAFRSARRFDAPDGPTAWARAASDLGPGLLAAIEAQGGAQARRDAFSEPPASEEHVLEPLTFLAGDAPFDVAPPPAADGEEVVGQVQLGALRWFLLLSEHVDPHVALRASDGWGGDAATVVDRGGLTCTRAHWRGDTDDDLAEMASALDTWVEAVPSASVEQLGSTLLVRACDDGGSAPTGRAGAAYALVATRAELFRDHLVRHELHPELAWCVAKGIVAEIGLDEARGGGWRTGPRSEELSNRHRAACTGA